MEKLLTSGGVLFALLLQTLLAQTDPYFQTVNLDGRGYECLACQILDLDWTIALASNSSSAGWLVEVEPRSLTGTWSLELWTYFGDPGLSSGYFHFFLYPENLRTHDLSANGGHSAAPSAEDVLVLSLIPAEKGQHGFKVALGSGKAISDQGPYLKTARVGSALGNPLDSAFHKLRLDYTYLDYKAQRISLTVDHKSVLAYEGNLITEVFGGKLTAHLGVGAGVPDGNGCIKVAMNPVGTCGCAPSPSANSKPATDFRRDRSSGPKPPEN